MRADEYMVLADCVERGVGFGWTRAHKHVEQPEPGDIMEQIEQEVLNAICEYFSFDSHGDEVPDDPKS